MGINLINLHAKVLDQCLVHGNYYVSNYLCNVLFHLICQIVPFHRLGFVNCPRLRSKKWGRTSIQSHKACVVSTQVYALLDLSHSKVHFRRPHFFLPFTSLFEPPSSPDGCSSVSSVLLTFSEWTLILESAQFQLGAWAAEGRGVEVISSSSRPASCQQLQFWRRHYF